MGDGVIDGNPSNTMDTAMAAGTDGSLQPAAGSAGTMQETAGAAAGSSTDSSSSGAGGSSAGTNASGAGAAGDDSGSTAGAAGMAAGSAGDGAGEPGDAGIVPMHEDLGKGDGRDVVLMGDSYMSNTLQLSGTGGGIAPSLQRESGQPYRNYGVQGVMLLSADLFGPAIPTQWDSAKRVDANIKTVVMTGGGNDVIQNPGLQTDCEMDGEQCREFRMKVVAALDELWTQMASDGVEDIIYVRYAAKSTTMMPMGSPSATVPAICTSGLVRCHALDTTDLVNGEIASDGIHPLRSANDRIAKAIVELMETEGMRR